ncbi:MAG: AraC family transcriptional regulator [Verrucomicrobia bacterium]|nr:AraC family transcriptional regulator [Verrucomicrobiota bacterium]
MISFLPSRSGAKVDARRLFIETFRRQIALLESGKARVRIPETRRLFERLPGMQYHFKPELFIQLGGETDFAFPDQKFTLGPGEICVMPKGVPHGEAVRSGARAFENVVVCFYNETVSVHVAHESPPGHPIVDDIHFFTTDLFHELVEYLNRAGELRLRDKAACATAIKGLLLAELSLLLGLAEEQDAARYSETERVFRCQWLIRNNLQDPDLSVEMLAAELRCSASHLSKLFHRETGERIVECLTRLRLTNAIDAVRQTALSVKEIAGACGFNDPNYFTRVFRKATGRSPVQYRADLHHVASHLEREPKVVFYDREEHDFGLRPEVMAKAVVKVTR